MHFRKILTRFCQLPGLIVPIVLLSLVARYIAGGDRYATGMFAWTLCVMLGVTFAIGAVIKFSYFKERPEPYAIAKWWHRIDASSFPSIHTAYATVFMAQAMMLSDMHSKMTNNLILPFVLSCAGIIFYILIARSRIVLKKHFFIDMIFGTIVGMIGVSFCLWHMEAVVVTFHLIFGF